MIRFTDEMLCARLTWQISQSSATGRVDVDGIQDSTSYEIVLAKEQPVSTCIIVSSN
jgi:hypothetical protein